MPQLKGIPYGPTLSGHCLCWIAAGANLENKPLIGTRGTSGNLYADQGHATGVHSQVSVKVVTGM